MGKPVDQQLSVNTTDQLIEIKEKINSVYDRLGGTSSDKVLVTTIVLEICRNLYTHIGSFKIQANEATFDEKQAVQIRIMLYKSDVKRLQQEQITMPEVLGLNIDMIRSVFDLVDAKIVADKEFSIHMAKYCAIKNR